jgi:XamI restriction endonuclease
MCRHPWICITTGFSPLRQLRLGESCHIHWKGTPRFQANGGPDFNHASYSGTQSSCSFHTAYVYCPTDRKRSFDWPSGCESYGCQAHGRRDNSNAYFRRNQNPGHWQDLRSYFALDRQRPKDLFPWLDGKRKPTRKERLRAALIVADRDCGASADPIVRNAQEERQLAMISEFLTKRGYQKAAVRGKPTDFAPGTFATHVIVPVSNATVNIPIDVVIQPQKPK